jgi:hypothetical protein
MGFSFHEVILDYTVVTNRLNTGIVRIRDAPYTGTNLAGYLFNIRAGYPIRPNTGAEYPAGFSSQRYVF